jgi:hypothetical protein
MTTVRANAAQVLRDILALDLRTCSIEVCLASVDEHEPISQFQRLLLSEKLKHTFRDVVIAVLNDYRQELQWHNLVLQDFNVESKPEEHEIEYLDLTSYGVIAKQIEPLNRFNSLDTFREEKRFISGLRFYVIIAQPPEGEAIYFFRHYTPRKMLSQSPFFGIRWLSNKYYYERIEEPVFLFDSFLDSISRGSDLFILKKEHFYYMFRFLEELLKTAHETLELIRARIPIANFDVFARSCSRNKTKMQKLRNIASQPYLSTITIEDMKKVIASNNLNIRVILVDGQEMLYYERRDPWAILKLLDDDYLQSLMTGQHYVVDSKHDLPIPG